MKYGNNFELIRNIFAFFLDDHITSFLLSYKCYIPGFIDATEPTNPTDNEGLVPLHYAACGNRLEQVKLLLKNGANVNALDNYGFTPLHYAASINCKEEVELLLKNGADMVLSHL